MVIWWCLTHLFIPYICVANLVLHFWVIKYYHYTITVDLPLLDSDNGKSQFYIERISSDNNTNSNFLFGGNSNGLSVLCLILTMCHLEWLELTSINGIFIYLFTFDSNRPIRTHVNNYY